MTPDLSIASTQTVGKRIVANTSLMVASRALGVVLGLGSIIIASRELDITLFGIVLFLHTYMLFFAEVVAFQSWQVIIRFGTDYVKDNDHKRLAKILNFGVKLDLLTALVGFILAVLCLGMISYIIQTFPGLFPQALALDIETTRNYGLLYCTLILLSQRGAPIGIFRLFDKFNVLAVKALIMPIVRFIGVLIAAYNDAGLAGFVLAWYVGSLSAYIFIPVMAIIELKRRNLLGYVAQAKVKLRQPGKGVWPFVIKTNIDSTLGAANLHLPTLMISFVFGPAWVAVYRIAEEVAKILSQGFVLLDQVIYPELAKLVSHGKSTEIWKIVSRTAIILMGVGGAMSVFVMLVGPNILNNVLNQNYDAAAPLASLLVPAAALLGIAAPLYPVLYAGDRPERAIYARGTGVIVYIISFFGLAFTIGKMAPGWAAILGNISAIIVVLFLTKRTLAEVSIRNEAGSTEFQRTAPRLNLIGQSSVKLWGLPLAQWQERAFKKAGVSQEIANEQNTNHLLHIGVEWVLSSALAKAFVMRSQTALISAGKIVGINGATQELASRLIGQSEAALKGTDLLAVYPPDLDDGYNKALRKTEPPYVINVHETPILDLQKRQFASSYKGITDFVTKWFWPVPAFYATRACAALRLTPNMVTSVGLVLTFLAMYYFWQGQWALGFAAGWLMTFLDTVDGKLARTTMTYSWWGNIYDHGIDLIHPPFWYFAWYVGLGGSLAFSDMFSQGNVIGVIAANPLMFALVAMLIGYVVDRIVEGLFLQLSGFHIHVWTRINSALRFFIARRNPNMFIFMIGIMLSAFFSDAGHIAFICVAIWTWLCIAFNILALIIALIMRRNAPLQSWMDF